MAIDLTGRDRNIAAIHALAKERPDLVNVSEPTGLDASKPLNVGPPGAPMEALRFVTVVFGTAKAALEFLKFLREQMNANGAAVTATEAATGKPLGRIESVFDQRAKASPVHLCLFARRRFESPYRHHTRRLPLWS